MSEAEKVLSLQKMLEVITAYLQEAYAYAATMEAQRDAAEAELAEARDTIGVAEIRQIANNLGYMHREIEIGELRAEVARLTAELAAARWIPVEERLPVEGQYVLAASRSMYAQTYHSWWYSGTLRDVFVRDNSHWLPLPQPPQGEGG